MRSRVHLRDYGVATSKTLSEPDKRLLTGLLFALMWDVTYN